MGLWYERWPWRKKNKIPKWVELIPTFAVTLKINAIQRSQIKSAPKLPCNEIWSQYPGSVVPLAMFKKPNWNFDNGTACGACDKYQVWLCSVVGVIGVIFGLKTTPRSSPTYLAANDWHLMVDPHTFCHTWNREWHGKMISLEGSFFLVYDLGPSDGWSFAKRTVW